MKNPEMFDEAVYMVAQLMCAAAMTAPKARGADSVVTCILTGQALQEFAEEMILIEQSRNADKKLFSRDAELVRKSSAVVLIGSRNQQRRLSPCGFCGKENCDRMQASTDSHCAFDDIDLGIAVGSAVSVAADNRIDNRVLYTAGIAAMRMKCLGDKTGNILGIPLSVSSRNIYFKR